MARLLQDGSTRLLEDGSSRLLEDESANTAPVIDVQPTNQSVPVTQTATFSLTASDPELDPLTYQWYEMPGDVLLVGEESDSMAIVTGLADDDRQFYCVVSDGAETVQSDTVSLEVLYDSMVISGPDDVTAYAQRSVAFEVSVADGFAPYTYQWYETTDGILPGETGDRLSFVVGIEDDGNSYYCVVTDYISEEATSGTASLSVAIAPVETVVDVRVLDATGNWVSLVGQDGDPGSNVIDDTKIRNNLTWSSSKIDGELSSKTTDRDLIELSRDIDTRISDATGYSVHGGGALSVPEFTVHGGDSSSVYAPFQQLHGGYSG